MVDTFLCKRKFKVWFFTPSHSTLIIRSEKQYDDVDYIVKYDEPDLTIDVEFTDVKFISIPQYFNEIKIKKADNKFIFNDNENWFIEAFSCVVGKSNFELNENVFSGLKYTEVIEIK